MPPAKSRPCDANTNAPPPLLSRPRPCERPCATPLRLVLDTLPRALPAPARPVSSRRPNASSCARPHCANEREPAALPLVSRPPPCRWFRTRPLRDVNASAPTLTHASLPRDKTASYSHRTSPNLGLCSGCR
ncbi:hypothetical protein B0H13DRAFT_2661264 [Mycena leptocephala]|nr:hypothetical protein B0H13DRAFT_2661264 [Mycena leptocephala]